MKIFLMKLVFIALYFACTVCSFKHDRCFDNNNNNTSVVVSVLKTWRKCHALPYIYYTIHRINMTTTDRFCFIAGKLWFDAIEFCSRLAQCRRTLSFEMVSSA